jgi:oxygen-dependent protoporphyrinogen oxidase
VTESNHQSQRVAVIGGGITGLAAANRLLELDPAIEVTVLEAGSRLGGVLETVRRDGFMVEQSADNFITNVPWATDLCRRIGLADQLQPTSDRHRRAFVVCRGRLEPIPEGFLIMAPSRLGPVLRTPILSPLGKLRLFGELFVPARKDADDESLASFVSRRLGRETYQRLVQPLVGGIYTADPEQLSVEATMPRFLEMERAHGSLIRAAWRQARARDKKQTGGGARYSMFVALRDGMSNLIDVLAARLPSDSVLLNTRVNTITQEPTGGWSLHVAGGSFERLAVNAVIVATPARQTAELLAKLNGEAARHLQQIQYASCAVVSLGYRRKQIGHPLDGFGFVTPAIERRQILSGSFSSVKYPGRAPAGCELLRVFIGGACQPDLVDLPDDRLFEIAQQEIASLLTVSGDTIFQDIRRWPSTMPQYHLGHVQLVARIRALVAQFPGLELAGNAYAGVGVPHCIHSGEQAAEAIVTAL